MDAGDYQLIAMAGIAVTGYIVKRRIEERDERFVNNFIKEVNEFYIPELNKMREELSMKFSKLNKTLDLAMENRQNGI